MSAAGVDTPAEITTRTFCTLVCTVGVEASGRRTLQCASASEIYERFHCVVRTQSQRVACKALHPRHRHAWPAHPTTCRCSATLGGHYRSGGVMDLTAVAHAGFDLVAGIIANVTTLRWPPRSCVKRQRVENPNDLARRALELISPQSPWRERFCADRDSADE